MRTSDSALIVFFGLNLSADYGSGCAIAISTAPRSGDSTPSGTLSWISSAWTRGSRGSLTAARHGGEPERHADERRTEYLASEGYRVLRFWDEEVLDNIDGVSKPFAKLL
jgi:hypothetical protein